MAKEKIEIPVICVDAIMMLRDAERGRLFRAVLEYQRGRELSLDGAEQYLFAVLKTQMDIDKGISASRAKSGKSGGLAKSSKTKQTKANDSTPPSPPSPPTPPVFPSLTPKEKPPKGGKEKGVFSPPTVDEIAAYCRQRSNGIDAESFFDHYEARGWKYNGNLSMKDWRAAVRTWEQRRRETGSDEPKTEYFRVPDFQT